MTEYQKHHKFMYHKIKYTKLPSPLFQKLNTNKYCYRPSNIYGIWVGISTIFKIISKLYNERGGG